MDNITIHTKRIDSLTEFLQLNDFEVTSLDGDVYRVSRGDELPVYLHLSDNNISFEVDLGNIQSIASEELYRTLLDANTDIQPVCFALDTTNAEDTRLILAESRITGDLSDQEILSVFDALELAADKAEALLKPFIA